MQKLIDWVIVKTKLSSELYEHNLAYTPAAMIA